MIAQACDLIAQRRRSHSVLVARPIPPTLPRIAAGPAGHNQNPKLVRLVEEFIAVEPPFQPDRIQVHIAHVGEIRIELGRRPPEQKIGRPRCAANQQLPSVDLE